VVANLGDPAPPGIVNRQRQRGSEYRRRFLLKPAPGEIKTAEIRVREPAAGAEQRFQLRGDDSRVGTFETLDHIGAKTREGPH
jgi:hypothetical protein